MPVSLDESANVSGKSHPTLKKGFRTNVKDKKR